jgi:hypothetical protein
MSALGRNVQIAGACPNPAFALSGPVSPVATGFRAETIPCNDNRDEEKSLT